MEVRFRDDKDIDYEQLLAMHRTTAWAAHRQLDPLKKLVANSQLLITGWVENRLVACLRVLTDYVYRAVIFDVIVEAELQELGIGKRILNQAVNHDSLKDVEYFFLYTNTTEGFYHRAGWKEFPGVPFYLVNSNSPNGPE